jgi:peroxiredoxin Q/BCP
LQAFAAKHNLPFTLLADEGNAVRQQFGIKGDFFGALPGRQTYVLDKKGEVRLVFNNQFAPEKHVAETIQVIEEIKSEQKGGLFASLFE